MVNQKALAWSGSNDVKMFLKTYETLFRIRALPGVVIPAETCWPGVTLVYMHSKEGDTDVTCIVFCMSSFGKWGSQLVDLILKSRILHNVDMQAPCPWTEGSLRNVAWVLAAVEFLSSVVTLSTLVFQRDL